MDELRVKIERKRMLEARAEAALDAVAQLLVDELSRRKRLRV